MEALYPFQRAGVDWLCNQPSGAILADDMGLGKTVQVIAAIRRLFNRAALRSVLLLCPKNLLANWEREFGRWAPELGVAVLSPGASLREQAWRAVFGRRHIVISNYEQMRSPPAALLGASLDLMVADEAHRLRRSRASPLRRRCRGGAGGKTQPVRRHRRPPHAGCGTRTETGSCHRGNRAPATPTLISQRPSLRRLLGALSPRARAARHDPDLAMSRTPCA